MLCAVAGNKTRVQKMYNINYIKKCKAFFTHYAYNRENFYFQDTVPHIKKIKLLLYSSTHTNINFIHH